MPSSTQQRSDYKSFLAIPTRWMDNDIYGHVNNVHYYSYFDTAVNRYLIDHGLLDIHNGHVVAYVVDTSCSYFRPLAFPDTVTAGIRITKIGNSSVRYEVGLFRNDEASIAASGHFVHVYVDRRTSQPISIPEATRLALAELHA